MKNAGYTLLYIVLKALALLPLGLLYIFADVLYLLVYHVVRYRRRVVRENIKACFPFMTEAGRADVERRFYHNFADYVVETVKLLHISDREMTRRMTFENLDIIDSLTEAGHDVIVYFSHSGNWEWGASMTMHMRRGEAEGVRYCQVYRPLSSTAFDRIMLRIRSRFGSTSIAKKQTLRKLVEMNRAGLRTVTCFMSDQKPSSGDPTLVLEFLSRPTAFITGTETLARKLGYAAVYWDISKPRRGHYHITCRLLTDDPAACQSGDITRRYAAMLEETIKRSPSIWLWTHNRWKHPVTLPPK